MLDVEKELSIMKHRILILEQALDTVEARMKQKDEEIENLRMRVRDLEVYG